MPWLAPVFVALGASAAAAVQISIFVISTAASLVVGQIAKALSKKSAAPTSTAASEIVGRTISSRQATAPRRVIYGFVNVGGTITYLSLSGTNNAFLDIVYTLTGHEVNAIGGMAAATGMYMYFDGVPVPLDGSGNATGTFAGLVHAEFNRGQRTETAFSGLVTNSAGLWTSAHRQRGCASVYVRLKYDATLFPNGLPNVTFDVLGKYVYDPRSGSRTPSSNAALCEADYIFNATFGLGAQSKYGLTAAQLSSSGVGSFSAAQSVDGNVTTKAWDTNAATSGAFVKIDLGSGGDQEFRRCRLYASAAGYAGTYQVEYSDDNVTWHSANPWYDFTPDEIEWNETELAPNGAHRYWRLRLTNTPGSSANINEVDFWVSDVDSTTLATAANTCDELVTVNISTTLTVAVSAGAQTGVTAASMHDIVPGVVIHISDGGNSEDVTITAVAADDSSFTATFAHAHSSGVTVSTGSELRYTCNGSFTTDAVAQDIIPQLNSAHGGSAVYTAGKWAIYPAVWRGSSLNLGDADLRASITVQTRIAHADLYNGVKGTFASPLNNWQAADFPPYQDPSYVLEDDNEQLWLDSIYAFTLSSATCQRLSKIALRRKRRQIQIPSAQFKLNAWQVQVADIVQFTHPRFSWSNKTFEVATCQLTYEAEQASSSGSSNANTPPAMVVGCDLSLIEMDSTVYDWTAASDEDALSVVPDSILPAPGTVAAPTSLALTAISVTRAADGVAVSGVRLTWTAPADQSVLNGGLIRVQHKLHSSGTWTDDGALDGAATIFDVIPLVDGTQYDFQIWAENLNGAKSAIVSGTKIPTASQLLIDTIGDGSNFYRPPQHVTVPTDDPYNSGFEIFPDGQSIADGWENMAGTGITSIGSRSAVPYNGTYAQNLANTAGGASWIASRPIAVKPGLQYLLRGRVIASSANVGNLYIRAFFYSDNNDLSFTGWTAQGSMFTDIVAAHTTNAASWTLWEGAVTAPATAKFCRIVLLNYLDGGHGGAGTAGTLTFDTMGWALNQISEAQGAGYSTSTPSTASTTPSTIPEMTATFTTYGGKVLILFNGMFTIVGGVLPGDNGNIQIYRDGSPVGPVAQTASVVTSSLQGALSLNYIDNPAAGSHTYTIRWWVTNGNGTLSEMNSRFIQTEEVA